MPLSAVILAAGKSTRMKSALPKPLHEICGRPMLAFILDAAFAAGADKVFVVVGYGKEAIIDCFGGDARIEFIEQKEQLGTGHAAKMCVPYLGAGSRESEAGAPDSASQLPTPNSQPQMEQRDVLILAGDVPLIRGDVLKQFVAAHREQDADASLATAELENPYGYGRVIRDGGRFLQIVEQADATPDQAAVREVFPSLYCVKADRLVDLLGRLRDDNAKREFYLTDIYGLCRQAGGKVLAVKCVQADDIIAPNTRAELAAADAIMQRRIIAGVLESGVSVVAPNVTYVEAGAEIGADTRLLPFTLIGAGATIGRSCTIGPFANVPRQAVVKDHTTLAGNVDSTALGTLAEPVT